MTEQGKCERREEVQWLRDRREIELAEWRGLEDHAHAMLSENRALWDDWEEERRRTQKLGRKIAKLRKRLAKWRDASVSTSGKWRKGEG